jgi:uncharacterized membrane protein
MTEALARPAADAAVEKAPRIQSIDFLRGVVIVIMALDHVRDYTTVARIDPLDPAVTDGALYLTRWITNFCAPVFVFLAGTSAGLQRRAGKSSADLSRFLLSRGLWLIFLELTVVLFGWKFNFQPMVFLQVIWAIGASMIILAALVRLPLAATAAFAAVLIVGHHLLDGVQIPVDFASPASAPGAILWSVLHQTAPLQIGPFFVFLAYPLVPWVGVMAAGYVAVELYAAPPEARRRRLIAAGAAMIALFVLLRATNFYGDPAPWAAFDSATKTAMSFFNTTKYPPSLSFLLMTLGPALILLALAERWRGRAIEFFVVFGRVPLFFYVIHIYAAHLAAVALGSAQGHPPSAMMVVFFNFPPDYGVGLSGVYAIWIAVVAALFPLCLWFGRVKRRSKAWWMAYF